MPTLEDNTVAILADDILFSFGVDQDQERSGRQFQTGSISLVRLTNQCPWKLPFVSLIIKAFLKLKVWQQLDPYNLLSPSEATRVLSKYASSKGCKANHINKLNVREQSLNQASQESMAKKDFTNGRKKEKLTLF